MSCVVLTIYVNVVVFVFFFEFVITIRTTTEMSHISTFAYKCLLFMRTCIRMSPFKAHKNNIFFMLLYRIRSIKKATYDDRKRLEKYRKTTALWDIFYIQTEEKRQRENGRMRKKRVNSKCGVCAI